MAVRFSPQRACFERGYDGARGLFAQQARVSQNDGLRRLAIVSVERIERVRAEEAAEEEQSRPAPRICHVRGSAVDADKESGSANELRGLDDRQLPAERHEAGMRRARSRSPVRSRSPASRSDPRCDAPSPAIWMRTSPCRHSSASRAPRQDCPATRAHRSRGRLPSGRTSSAPPSAARSPRPRRMTAASSPCRCSSRGRSRCRRISFDTCVRGPPSASNSRADPLRRRRFAIR